MYYHIQSINLCVLQFCSFSYNIIYSVHILYIIIIIIKHVIDVQFAHFIIFRNIKFVHTCSYN